MLSLRRSQPGNAEAGSTLLLPRPPPPSPDANKGERRDLSRCFNEILLVKRKRGGNTYELEPLIKGSKFFARRVSLVSADRVVPLLLPTWGRSSVGRRVEYTSDGDRWTRGRVEDMAVDGRVLVRREDNPVAPEWVDLAKLRYRWLADAYGKGSSGDAGEAAGGATDT